MAASQSLARGGSLPVRVRDTGVPLLEAGSWQEVVLGGSPGRRSCEAQKAGRRSCPGVSGASEDAVPAGDRRPVGFSTPSSLPEMCRSVRALCCTRGSSGRRRSA